MLRRIQGRFYLSLIPNRGRRCRILGSGSLICCSKIQLGDAVSIGEEFFIVGTGGVEIGSHTIISRRVVIQSQSHFYDGDLIPFNHVMVYKKVKIGRAVWIGMGAVILPGVSVGDGAIIGMGAVVTKDVPAGGICVGNPGVIKKYRDMEKFDALFSKGAFKRK